MSAEHSAVYAIIWQALRESGAAASWDVEFSGSAECETLTVRRQQPVPAKRRTVSVPRLASVPVVSGDHTPGGGRSGGAGVSVTVKPPSWFAQAAPSTVEGDWCDNCGVDGEPISRVPGQGARRSLCSACLVAGFWPGDKKVRTVAGQVHARRAARNDIVPAGVG